MERDSELPDNMIQYILSFLPAEEAVKTSLLSKTWLRAWSTIPDLNFSDERFCKKLFGEKGWDLHRKDEQVVDKFSKFVDNTLQRHNLCLNKFELSLYNVDSKLASFVDKWLGIVVAKDVKQLTLFLNVLTSILSSYTLPQTIFAAKSLVSLKVCATPTIGFKVGDQLVKKCYTMKKLYLSRVVVSESTIRSLSSIFPCIEELTFDGCYSLNEIELSNLPNLKKIYVSSKYSPTVEITEAHSLESFTYYGSVYRFSKQQYFNIFPSQSLKYLSIDNSSITSIYLDNLLSQSPFLEDLILDYCQNLEWINISSTTLKSLQLSSGVRLEEVKIDAPNLIVLDYVNTVYPSLSLTSRSKDLVPSLYIISMDADVDASFFIKLRRLLAELRPSQMSLNIMCSKISLDIEELRKVVVLDPKPKLENLEMELSIYSGISTCSALLDGLFWSFCLESLTVVVYKRDEQELLKFLCKELMDRRSPDCCDSNQIMCWRHYLHHVDVEYIEESEKSEENEDQKIIRSRRLDWKSWVDGSFTFDHNTEIRFTLNW